MKGFIWPFVIWLLFVAAFLLIANLIIRLIAKRTWSKRPVAAEANAAAHSKVKPVERIWLDNPVFFLIRVGFFKLDNALFNRKGAVGPDYQPPRMILVLPYWIGLICFLFVIILIGIISHLYGVENSDDNWMEHIYCWHVFTLPLTVILNTLLFSRNMFIFRDRIRKTLYPCFIAVCSAIMAFLGFWTAIILLYGCVVVFWSFFFLDGICVWIF